MIRIISKGFFSSKFSSSLISKTCSILSHWLTRWWFKIFFMFTPIPGEMIQSDELFSNGLKPPTSLVFQPLRLALVRSFFSLDPSADSVPEMEVFFRWPLLWLRCCPYSNRRWLYGYMGVSTNRGTTPKMDGLFHGKTLWTNGWFGWYIPLFLVQHPYDHILESFQPWFTQKILKYAKICQDYLSERITPKSIVETETI